MSENTPSKPTDEIKAASAFKAWEKKIHELTKEIPEQKEEDIRKTEEKRNEAMDEAFRKREAKPKKAYEQKGADGLWKVIAAAIDAGVVNYLTLDKRAAKSMRGRGVAEMILEKRKH